MVNYSTSIALLAAAALFPAASADDDKRALARDGTSWPQCKDGQWTAIQCKDFIDEYIMGTYTDDDRFIRSHIAGGGGTRDTEEEWYEVVAIPMDSSNDLVTGRDGDGIIHYDYMWDGCGTPGSTAVSVRGSSKRLGNGRWFGPWDCSGKTGFNCCADIKADVANAGHDRAVHCFLDYDEVDPAACPPGPANMRGDNANKVVIFPDDSEMVPNTPQLHLGSTLHAIAGIPAYWAPAAPACEDDPAWSTRTGTWSGRLLQPKYKSCSWFEERFVSRYKMMPWRCAMSRGTGGKMANEACLESCKTQWMTRDGSAGCPS